MTCRFFGAKPPLLIIPLIAPLWDAFRMQIVFVFLYITPYYYHHFANISEDIELIKCLSDIFCRVCKTKHILSVIHYMIYGAVCFQRSHFPCDDWENIYIYTLFYSHHQIGNMNYYALFRARSWNNGMRCMVSTFFLRIFSTKFLSKFWHLESRKLIWKSRL